MNLARYEPWGLHREVLNEFNRFFERFGAADETASSTADWLPPVDIEEHEDRYVLHADVPGMDPADIEITLENGLLTLAGTRTSEKETNGKNGGVTTRRVERVTGRFLRRFTLPESVDAEGVKASGKNGVLEIVIPKSPAAKPRKIAVNG